MLASTSNFDFLHDEFPVLYTIGKEAEFQIHHDPAAALFKLRVFGEKLVERLHAELAAPVQGKRGRKAKEATEAPLFE